MKQITLNMVATESGYDNINYFLWIFPKNLSHNT